MLSRLKVGIGLTAIMFTAAVSSAAVTVARADSGSTSGQVTVTNTGGKF